MNDIIFGLIKVMLKNGILSGTESKVLSCNMDVVPESVMGGMELELCNRDVFPTG